MAVQRWAPYAYVLDVPGERHEAIAVPVHRTVTRANGQVRAVLNPLEIRAAVETTRALRRMLSK